ncbi:MAG: amidohydrolase family protein [Hyphomonadaceae bacterium]|nr:amidohydrolase family protein [Hyphomonadaceae bacterium]
MIARTAIIALLAAAAAPALAHAQARAPETYIHAGRLLADPATGRVETERTIVVSGDKVVRVEAGYAAPTAGARVIDLKNKFVLPGLMDSHVHITRELGPGQFIDEVSQSSANIALMGAVNARKTVEAGFTTVADLGADSAAVFALRDAIAAGGVTGPRIIASGSPITPTGGHGDVQGYRDDVNRVLASPTVCNGADDCRRAVRAQVQRGADVIKVTATGGVLSNTRAGLSQQLSDDELKAIAETAHSLGRKVTAHAHGVDGVNAALRAGFDSIEHGTYLNAESIQLMRRNGATLVPTVLAGAWVSERARDAQSYLSPAQKEKALTAGPLMLDMLRRAREGRVTVAFGTDTGVSPHGMNAREAELWVEAGFTPLEVIRAATVIAAKHLQVADTAGALKPGLSADIIAVDGDPTQNISLLRDVKFVMARGAVVK